MASKQVRAEITLGTGTRIDCKAGDHTFIIDQTKAGGGENLGPSPLEYYLASLAGCVASIARIVAKQKQINLRGMTIGVSGEINTDVLLGRTTEERAGFQTISLQASVDADLDEAEKIQFLSEVERRCPVSDNTTYASKVLITLV